MRCPERAAAGTSSAGQPRKRRKLPPSFFGKVPPSEQCRKQAAERIQKFVRWRRSLVGQIDPILHEPIRPCEAVMLLETGGVRHWFNASSLASYFISTACFNNPLSRRPLWCWEVNRILLMQPRRMRPLIAATYIARFALQKDAHENEGAGLASSVEESLDIAFERLLCKAELLFFEFRLEGFFAGLEDYEDNLLDLVCVSQGRAKTLCLRHREVVKNRGIFCPQLLGAELADIQERLVMKKSGGPSDAADHIPILKTALMRRLQFQ